MNTIILYASEAEGTGDSKKIFFFGKFRQFLSI